MWKVKRLRALTSTEKFTDSHSSRRSCFGYITLWVKQKKLIPFEAVGESMQFPLIYYKNNMVGMINLLEESNLKKSCCSSQSISQMFSFGLLQVMKQHNIFKLVFSSSCTVYGEPETLPITEEKDTGKVTNVYGRTKFFIEEMLKDLCVADDVNW
jgi:UDP-glucose 4-epimerase